MDGAGNLLILIVILGGLFGVGFGAFALFPFKGRRAANRAVRKVAKIIPGAKVSKISGSHWYSGSCLKAQWPLWFNREPDSGEPGGWLVVESSDCIDDIVLLLKDNNESNQYPHHLRSFAWRRWPKPFDATVAITNGMMCFFVEQDVRLGLTFQQDSAEETLFQWRGWKSSHHHPYREMWRLVDREKALKSL